MYIILEGNRNTIAGIIGIIESLNKQSGFSFTYSTAGEMEKMGSITIMANEPEHFYVLGGANALFLKETLKPVAAQLIER